jgi:PEP-CTERM motif
MNHSRVLVIALVFVAATAGALRAKTVVNIDFGLHGDHPDGPTSVAYTGLGAADDPGGTAWNNIEVLDDSAFTGPPGEFGFWATTVTQSNLLNSDGLATSIDVQVIGDPSNGTGVFGIVETATNNLAAVATNARDLMRDYLIGFDAPRQVVLNGFTPGIPVDLYLYGAGDTSNRDTVFTVVDNNGTHSATTTGTLTNDVNNPVAHTLTLGADYVVLPAIVTDNTGSITINYFHGAGSGEAPFNGLQAVFGIIPGDVDDDNDVDLVDYQLIRNNFRTTGATRAGGDLTGPGGGNVGDGVVDFYDFAQWQENFPTAGGSLIELGNFPVPEPANIGLAMIALVGLATLRRRKPVGGI